MKTVLKCTKSLQICNLYTKIVNFGLILTHLKLFLEELGGAKVFEAPPLQLLDVKTIPSVSGIVLDQVFCNVFSLSQALGQTNGSFFIMVCLWYESLSTNTRLLLCKFIIFPSFLFSL